MTFPLSRRIIAPLALLTSLVFSYNPGLATTLSTIADISCRNILLDFPLQIVGIAHGEGDFNLMDNTALIITMSHNTGALMAYEMPPSEDEFSKGNLQNLQSFRIGETNIDWGNKTIAIDAPNLGHFRKGVISDIVTLTEGGSVLIDTAEYTGQSVEVDQYDLGVLPLKPGVEIIKTVVHRVPVANFELRDLWLSILGINEVGIINRYLMFKNLPDGSHAHVEVAPVARIELGSNESIIDVKYNGADTPLRPGHNTLIEVITLNEQGKVFRRKVKDYHSYNLVRSVPPEYIGDLPGINKGDRVLKFEYSRAGIKRFGKAVILTKQDKLRVIELKGLDIR